MNNPGPPPPPPLPPASEPEPEVDLQARFPRMKPVKGAPPLFRLNGCGTAMFGRRKFDPETGTYLKNYCLTLVFIPVLPLSCYRVADAQGGGWYFLGKERISGAARMTRATVLVAVLFTILGVKMAIDHNAPEAVRERKLAEPAEAADGGDPLKAAGIVHEIAKTSGSATPHLETMDGYLDRALASENPATQLGSVDLMLGSPFWRAHFHERTDALSALCLERANALLDRDPRTSVAFSIRLRRLDEGGSGVWVVPMKSALESLASRPGEVTDADIARLADLYVELGETEAVIGLLESRAPFAAGSPLAMRLGRALLREGRPAEAAGHLATFTETRFPQWLSLQERVYDARVRAYDAAIDFLNEGRAPQAFYDAYEKAGEVEQEDMVSRHALTSMAQTPEVRRLESEIEALDNPPSVVMDLGIACLEAGHAAEPENREAWFERAEKAFLSLREHAEDSPDFQFFYGQVCYWLGKSREGAELFDRLIKEHGDDAGLLSELGDVLRGVGETDKARAVFKQAFEHAGDDTDMRTSCIISLAILAESLEERVEYLEQGDRSVPRIVIDLAEARAAQAVGNGDRETARKLYQEALEGYGGMQETSATLNNAALVHFEIFGLGGGRSHQAEGLRKMEAALALEPNDSILCHNAASRFLSSAAHAMLAEAIEPGWAPFSRGFGDLRLLYHDDVGRAEVLRRFTTHPDYLRGRALLERALVLAPENRSLLGEAMSLASILRDAALAENLASRLENSVASGSVQSLDAWIEEMEGEEPATILESLEKSRVWHAEARERVESDHAKATLDVRDAANLLSYDYWTPDLDSAGLLEMIDRAMERWPCSEFHDVQTACARLVVWRDLCRAKPEVAEWAGDALRMLDTENLLLLAVMRFDGMLGHPGVRAALETSLDYSRRFPSSYSPRDAVLAELLGAADHGPILEAARSHPAAAPAAAYARRVKPHSPSTAIQQLWLRWVADDRATAIHAYKETAAGHPWLPDVSDPQP